MNARNHVFAGIYLPRHLPTVHNCPGQHGNIHCFEGYEFGNVTDALDNIAFFVINCYPNDLPAEEVDINRFYHALANTSKHVMGGIYTMEGLRSVIDMAEEIAGSREKLLERPFVSFMTLMMSPLVIGGDLLPSIFSHAKRQ
jgi:trimethylamine--corrinoid protein Co-methyltransferase